MRIQRYAHILLCIIYHTTNEYHLLQYNAWLCCCCCCFFIAMYSSFMVFFFSLFLVHICFFSAYGHTIHPHICAHWLTWCFAHNHFQWGFLLKTTLKIWIRAFYAVCFLFSCNTLAMHINIEIQFYSKHLTPRRIQINVA